MQPRRTQRTRRGVELNEIGGIVVDVAMKVYGALGEGLLEKAYQACLKHEIAKHGLQALSEVQLPVLYLPKKLSGCQ